MHGRTQISRLQLTTILLWTALGTGIVTIPALVAQFTVADGWMAGLSIGMGGGFAALMAHVFARRFPGRSLMETILDVCGPWCGRWLGLWHLSSYVIVIAAITREIDVFVSATALPSTPEWLISLLFLMTVAYIAYLGIEVIARVAETITPFALFVGPLLLLLALKNFDLHELTPVLGDGWRPVLRASLVPALAYGTELFIVLQLLPALRSPATVGRDVLTATAIIMVLLSAAIAVSFGVSGAAVSHFQYPILEAVRSVRFSWFLERIDTLYVMAVLITLIIKLAVFLFALCDATGTFLQLPSPRMLTGVVALLMWSAHPYMFRTVADLAFDILEVGPLFVFSSFAGVPLLVLAVHWVRQRWPSVRDGTHAV
ncbi:GerAB/ArcD/ProY family transporter [Alicyclobacillus cellulosilyticus]|nr:endospore germination permease [Alicyclobacillus cellulosilyticus]